MVTLSLFIHAIRWCPEKGITVQPCVLLCPVDLSKTMAYGVGGKEEERQKLQRLFKPRFTAELICYLEKTHGSGLLLLFHMFSVVLHPVKEPHGACHTLVALRRKQWGIPLC